ncbi:cytochrome c [Variovorax sp. YR216]|uniref:c-type cytochrome n=1 Tax=Variovorax sp. YR216 TaxID=1882828 RepID=UPI00089D56A0|nr:c-type cytochrome [Variovorax sp. YR216]SEB13900.1 Cytochrome C oxidase, cbb3-type, subunit III [Variovorax sp. YR216]
MKVHGMPGWSNPWFRKSVIWLIVLTVGAFLVGFVLLPSVHGDFSAKGLWASICRAAGVPSDWSFGTTPREAPTATDVVLDRAMGKEGSRQAIGRGATLALNCTMCHGAQGMSTSDAPNLAGQYPEVIIKQLMDYRSGKRASPIMVALATNLSDADIADLAAYYASLPKARTAPTTYDEALPALVRVGAPLRNVAPCVSCHGGIDQKFGAPWLEGMPKGYLALQLKAFRSGERGNDSEAQMRNVARSMTNQEIEEVSVFYARKAGTPSE